MENFLKFRIWGDYGQFRRYYTNASPLTFDFPPPPTIWGMISAIIGLDKDEYLNYFQNTDEFKIALNIASPVKKTGWSQNLLDTKDHFWRIKNRTPTRVEFLKDPSFIIYFRHNNCMVMDELKKHLVNHISVYSLALGLSELLGNFEFCGEMEADEKTDNEWVNIDSVIPQSRLLDNGSIDFELDLEIFKVNYPVLMKPDREVIKREEIIYERTGQSIRSKVKNYWETESGEKFVIF